MSASEVPYKTVFSPDAPKAIGPYSPGTIHNGVVYLSGCISFIPETMELLRGGIEAETEQTLKNLFANLKAANSGPSHVLKTTVFLKDMNDFDKMNAVFEKFFAPYKPARSAIEIARLPRDALVEIECIAAVKE
ncbi:uncharacterized protein PFL1_00368 [Pseudozyma flocculosa PF-1]|uniref:uncharacterized protein n=1 Tax=Pseudozyma flocculosa PF-1 TaxID=1277687 RepID=UPI000456193A|nr:uncharacterized protein PFL1_00368 [Pseudozyma flocculosa PF-1]EPQ32171.1 hypothetical protein PFL1_00368 [Pseudozyma flocculosa PF-1]